MSIRNNVQSGRHFFLSEKNVRVENFRDFVNGRFVLQKNVRYPVNIATLIFCQVVYTLWSFRIVCLAV